MKHRFIALVSVLVIVASLGATFVHPATVHAATAGENAAATLYCGKYTQPVATGGGQSLSYDPQKAAAECQKGFLAALANNASKPPSSNAQDKKGYCYTNLYKGDNSAAAICQDAYIYAYNNKSTVEQTQPGKGNGPGDTNPDAATQTACINDVWGGDAAAAKAANNGDLLKDCITGYQAQQSSKNENAACGASQVDPTQNNNIDYVYCTKGYDAAAADSSNNNNDNPPDCESVNDGFNISWAICPIIEGLANATDGIYTSIIQPLLITKPINLSNPQKDPSNTFAVWSNFRLYGNIFLVIALLVIVFGESIGGGMIDAYTAKKVLPRLLVAAILINISIYLVAIAVDVTNIIGNGIAALMQAPFHEAACAAHVSSAGTTVSGTTVGTTQNCFALKIGGGTQALGGLGLIALIAGTGGTLWALLSGGSSAVIALSILGPLVKFLLLFVLLPAFLTFVAIMITVVLRQGLILFLVFIAPVAFALYCLPNTEQYFRKWWDLLFKTLLIYPLIAVFFALGNILSVTISSATGGLSTVFGDILAITALFVPLFMIPFSFRIAGGVLGRFHELATNTHKRGQEFVKGNENDPNSLRNRTRRNVGAGITRGKAQAYRSWKSTGRAPRLGQYLLGGSIEKEALLTQQAKKRIGDIKDNGDDSIVNARASFIDPTDGKRKTLDGKDVTEMDWKASKRLHPTLGEMQAVAEYRAGKITSTEQGEQFMRNYALMAQQQGLSTQEAGGMMTGFSFGKQNEFGHLKYGDIDQDPTTGQFVYRPVGGAQSFEVKPADQAAYQADPVETLANRTRAASLINENYYNRDGFGAGKQKAGFWQAMADTKAGYLGQYQAYLDRGGTGGMTPEEVVARDKLKQIAEMQETFKYGGMSIDEATGAPVRSGKGQLQGASAATQAAFAKLEAMDRDPAHAIMGTLKSEITSGQTYEAAHSRHPGQL